MQEIRTAKVNNRDVPILISDEKEALLAAKAAGRAIVGLWDSGHPEKDLSPAVYLVEKPEDADEEFLERVARRHLGLPWKICETKRTIVRELRGEEFMELWDNQVGLSFSSPEELEVYTKNQYAFYGFGFWGIVEKKSGELIGVAGLRVPEEADGKMVYGISWEDAPPDSAELELGYHIFVPFRRKGFAKEVCNAILSYAKEDLFADHVTARIAKDNLASESVAASLGMKREN